VPKKLQGLMELKDTVSLVGQQNFFKNRTQTEAVLEAFQLSKGTETTNCTGRLLNCKLKAQLHGQAQE